MFMQVCMQLFVAKKNQGDYQHWKKEDDDKILQRLTIERNRKKDGPDEEE